MHPRTVAALEEIENASWFSRVGIKEESSTAIVLASWPEAIEYCDSSEWENLRLDALNHIVNLLRVAQRNVCSSGTKRCVRSKSLKGTFAPLERHGG